MNHTPRTIHKILAEWGRTQRTLPSNNDTLKNNSIEKLYGRDTSKASYGYYRLPWLSFALTSLAVATLFLAQTPQPPPSHTYSSVPGIEEINNRGIGAPEESKKSMGDARQKIYPYPSVYPEPRPSSVTPVTDRREFLKTGYSAWLRTRRVTELTRRIQTIIRGFDGRVDASTAAKRWGYVEFAVPAGRFESFRQEIKSLVPARFIVEETHSENLLSQKRSIEEQEEYTKKTLAELKANRESVTAAHTQTVRSLKNRIAAITKDLEKLRAEGTDDPQRKADSAAEEQRLLRLIRNLQGSLVAENTAYANRLDRIDAEIKGNEITLEGIYTQDQNLIDTVATVEGRISLEWINIWEIVHLYFPLYWFALLSSLGAVTAFILHQRRSNLIIL